jgi:hypothetical protein
LYYYILKSPYNCLILSTDYTLMVDRDSELPAALNEDVKINREARMELPSSSLRSSMSGNRVIGRQLISWGVSTSTVTAIATFTSVLTAVCASTSGFAACVSG